MIKIIKPMEDTKIIKMCDMEPLQVGQIVENGYSNEYVMRTQNIDVFEVMNLSNSEPDGCWEEDVGIKVRLLEQDEKITIELSND